MVVMAVMSEVLSPLRVVTVKPEMPEVDSTAICEVVMKVLSALTCVEVNTPSAGVLRLARFVVLMLPMAVTVRPEACAVPIRCSCPGSRRSQPLF